MYKKQYFLGIFFTIIFVISTIRLYDNAFSNDAWQYGEWLINYQSGFVRRGLLGEIIYIFSTIINNDIRITFIIFISFLCFIYYCLSYYLIKDLKLNFLHLFIIFSPLFYLFFVIISKVGVKKEIIFYIYFLLYLIHLSSKNLNIRRNLYFIITFPLLLLNHEGIFFYLPYIVLPLIFVANKKNTRKIIFQSLLLLMFSSIVMLILYFNKGSLNHTLTICQSLGDFAPMKCDWWGPIFALSHDVFIANDNKPNLFFYLLGDFKTNAGFLFYIIYSFVPLLVFYKFLNIKDKRDLVNKRNIFFVFFFIFLFSFPIFHLAEDWSRWFSIHFHLMSFFLFFLERKKIINYSRKFTKINSYFLGKKMKKYFFILLFFYATSFHHPHFFLKGVKLEFTYYKVLKKINY